MLTQFFQDREKYVKPSCKQGPVLHPDGPSSSNYCALRCPRMIVCYHVDFSIWRLS